MKRKYYIGIAVPLLLFITLSFLYRNVSFGNPVSDVMVMYDNTYSSIGCSSIPEDNKVGEDFSSHLPLIVIDINGKTIPTAYKWNNELEILEPIEGVNPYVQGNIYVYNSDTGVNNLSQSPNMQSAMRIKYRGNSSLYYEKKQYKINLLTDTGENRKEDLLGLGVDNDWVLNISMADESLLRNYLAYTIAGKLDRFTPDVKFCEVLIKEGDSYIYEGLYLLVESVKVSEQRVDIKGKSYNSVTPYMVKRDRYDFESRILNTWATENNLCYGYLSVIYPKNDELTDERIQYIENSISTVEKFLYSDDVKRYEALDKYIDVDSFVDYFLINEFFGNYDAGNNSTYMYTGLDGKIHMGPIWDFDNSMDNYIGALSDPTSIAFQEHPWFDKLCEIPYFTEALEKRYKELSRCCLNSEYMDALIDETVLYLGNSIQRDRSRWSQAYEEYELGVYPDENGIEINRNLDSYEDNVQKVKDYISEHSYYMDKDIMLLNKSNDSKYYAVTYEYAAILMVIAFLCAVVVVRRK